MKSALLQKLETVPKNSSIWGYAIHAALKKKGFQNELVVDLTDAFYANPTMMDEILGFDLIEFL